MTLPGAKCSAISAISASFADSAESSLQRCCSGLNVNLRDIRGAQINTIYSPIGIGFLMMQILEVTILPANVFLRTIDGLSWVRRNNESIDWKYTKSKGQKMLAAFHPQKERTQADYKCTEKIGQEIFMTNGFLKIAGAPREIGQKWERSKAAEDNWKRKKEGHKT